MPVSKFHRAIGFFNLSEEKFFKMDREDFLQVANKFIEGASIIEKDDNAFFRLDNAKDYLLTRWPEPKPKPVENKLNWWDRVKPKG